MKNIRKQRLIDLGAESLADALLELAIWSNAADDLVERIIAAPEENIQCFKKKLSSIKRSQRFIGWRESSGFATELQALLEDLRAGVSDPSVGIKLISSFYEADGIVLNKCDDSNGNIGDVYRIDAKELFGEYAVLCEDKEKVASIIFELSQNDDYGVRDTLIDCAAECLPEAIIRSMIAKIQELVKCEEDGYKKRHNLILIESLARQIKDAELFKQTRIASQLERGYTKAYPNGIRYLKKLDKLAALISDWNNFDNHEEFKDHIYKTHSRKRSFWSKYK